MFRMLKNFMLLLVAVGLLLTALYIEKEQSAVRSLPVLVQARLKAHGGTYVPLAQIPRPLQQAVIDTEDRTFYTNMGVSLEGIARSAVKNLISGKYEEGGSTITQQLARDFFLSPQKTLSRKLREVILALLITRDFSKDDILAMYLNSVYFGHGAWGVDAAARVYFNQPVSRLSFAQGTLLAGLPQAPSYLDPLKNYQAARARQWEVLKSMVEVGDIDRAKAMEIWRVPPLPGSSR